MHTGKITAKSLSYANQVHKSADTANSAHNLYTTDNSNSTGNNNSNIGSSSSLFSFRMKAIPLISWQQELPALLLRDTELLVCCTRALFKRVDVDTDLSMEEVSAYSSVHTESAHLHSEPCAITLWLGLRQSLIHTLLAVLDSCSRLGLLNEESMVSVAKADARAAAADSSTGTKSGPGPDTPRSPRNFKNRIEAKTILAVLTSEKRASDHEILLHALSTPLNKLVWLLRDLCDCSPIIDARPDLVLLCLNHDSDAQQIIGSLWRAATRLPYVVPESEAKTSTGKSDAGESGHIRMALTHAREDLVSGCISIMQLLSTTSTTSDCSDNSMAHEGYFQHLLDRALYVCIPACLKADSGAKNQSFLRLLLGEGAVEDDESVFFEEDEEQECEGEEGGGKANSNADKRAARSQKEYASGCAMAIQALLKMLAEPDIKQSPHLLAMRERLYVRIAAIRVYVNSRLPFLHENDDVETSTTCTTSTTNTTNHAVDQSIENKSNDIDIDKDQDINIDSEENIVSKSLQKQFSKLVSSAALTALLHMASPAIDKYEYVVSDRDRDRDRDSFKYNQKQTPAIWCINGKTRNSILRELSYLLGDTLGVNGHGKNSNCMNINLHVRTLVSTKDVFIWLAVSL